MPLLACASAVSLSVRPPETMADTVTGEWFRSPRGRPPPEHTSPGAGSRQSGACGLVADRIR
jgi:hypothetical protein